MILSDKNIQIISLVGIGFGIAVFFQILLQNNSNNYFVIKQSEELDRVVKKPKIKSVKTKK